MSSLFSKIISGEISSYNIAEDKNHLAFLDISPIARGHVLVIAKKPIDYIFDISTVEYLDLWKFAQKVAKAMKDVIPCNRIGIAVIGLEVPHAHIHLVPINQVSDINFEKQKLSFSELEMQSIADLIKSAI